MRDYGALPLQSLTHGTRLRPVTPHSGERLTLDSRALSIMTDFAVVPAATIVLGASIEEANRFMIHRGVRSLLVLDYEDCVVGIITAADILGERPMQIAQERRVSHDEILVREVMTPIEQMDAVPAASLLDAKIGHVVATLLKARRQHALVVERGASGDVLRGIFSLSHIAAALGISLEASAIAGTFAEVKAALAR